VNEQKNYKEIVNKYEILQKEKLDAKSKLTAEKEKLQRYFTLNHTMINLFYFYYKIISYYHLNI